MHPEDRGSSDGPLAARQRRGAGAAMTVPRGRAASDVIPPRVRAEPPRRRPTGAPPPLPRKLGASGRLWLGLAVVGGAALIWLFPQNQPQLSVDFETWVLRSIAELRADWLTPAMHAISAAGTGWTPTILGGATVVLLLIFKRWPHLFAFLGALVVLGNLLFVLSLLVKRPRPYEIEILGPWTGFAMPSFPVAILTAFLVGMTYSLVVPGRPRQLVKWAIAVVVAIVA